jgi:hypothetical protein
MQAAQESAAEGVPAQEVRQGSVLAARQLRLGSVQCGVPGCTSLPAETSQMAAGGSYLTDGP